MTLDEFNEYAKTHDYVIFTRQQYEHVRDVMKSYKMMQLDYKYRLRADMVAILEDLRLGIEEMEHCITSCSDDTYISYNDTWQMIQERINDLKENDKFWEKQKHESK